MPEEWPFKKVLIASRSQHPRSSNSPQGETIEKAYQ
jgi:hypothetical protein